MQSPALAGTPRSVPLNPTTLSERIQVLDILRGLAIFGILMVNMQYFTNPWGAPSLTADSSAIDHVVAWIINAFFASKFYTLFSFLFGLGMSIQMSRAERAGVRFAPLYLRRLFILLLFGLAHGILLWNGDILFVYAVLGSLLLLFWRNAKPRTLLIWAGILLGVNLLIYGLGAGAMALGRATPEGAQALSQIATDTQAAAQANLTRDLAIYGTGSFIEITAERFTDFIQIIIQYDIWMAPSVLMMFLLGMYFGKRRLLHDADDHLPFFRRLLGILLPIGLITNIAWASMGFDMATGGNTMDPMFLVGMMLLGIGGPALSLSYVSIAVLLTRSERFARALAPFAAVGRMALSNYLTHSIVMTTLFYGYGFGLLGTVGMAGGAAIGIALYAIQIPVSIWWMNRFQFGPFEWVWRSLTYGHAQTMRIPRKVVAI
jgi:uncharacterized protein